MPRIKSVIRDFVGFIYYNGYKRFMSYGNRCLIYHAFGSKLNHDTYGISINIDKFESHIRHLSTNYNIVNINDVTSNDLRVSISIDDGYKDTLDAVNILVKYDIPFTLFITAKNLNKKMYLSNRDLNDISLIKNAKIGTHGLSHSKLGTLSYKEQYHELSLSKKILEDLISKDVNLVSYPHGSYNNDTLSIIDKIGYKYAACSKKGFNSINTNKYLLHRSEIIASDEVINLTSKIKGYYDYY